MTEEFEDLIYPCKECQAGQMRRRFLTYFTWMGDELVTVPDFPAWVCDVCGRREYDVQAVNQLMLILSPNAGKSSTRPPKMHKKPSSKDQRPSHPESS
jgi:YgiT-type zinc finger domain-containing protein